MPAITTTEHINVIPAYPDGLRLGDLDQTIVDNSGGTPGLALAAGIGRSTLPLYVNLAEIAANGDLLTTFVPGHRFRILAVDFAVVKAVTTAAKRADLALEIGTTAVTGGLVSLTSAVATPQGKIVAGSAVTAANSGGVAAAISVLATNVTAHVEGSGWLLVTLQNLDTADALATLAALLSGTEV